MSDDEGGVEWEIGRAVDALIALLPAEQTALRKALVDYAAGIGGLASSQAAKSTLFVVAQLTILIEQSNQMREDIADLKTLIRDVIERQDEAEQTREQTLVRIRAIETVITAGGSWESTLTP